MLADVPKVVSTPELRVDVEESRKFRIVDEAIRHFRETHEVIDVDGARVLFGDGGGLGRASTTRPLLLLRFAARRPRAGHTIPPAGGARRVGVDGPQVAPGDRVRMAPHPRAPSAA